MYCKTCGKPIPFWARYCSKCGSNIPDTATGRIRFLRLALYVIIGALALSLAGAYFSGKSNLPNKEILQQIFGIIFLASFAALMFLGVVTIIIRGKKIISNLIHRPVLLGFLLAIFVILGLVVYTGFRYQPSSLKVAVVKGPISGASVSIYELGSNGEKGRLIDGPRTSDGEGSVNFTLPSDLPKRLLIEAKGGWYQDEATGKMVYLKNTDLLTAVLPAGAKTVAVTPFTHMAAALAKAKIRTGVKPDMAVISANEAVAKQYGLKSILNLPSGDKQYGLALGGVAQLAKNLKVRPSDLVEALAKDWSDGKVDGKQNGQAVVVSGGKALGEAGAAGLSNATTQFAKTAKAPSPKGTSINVNPPPVKNPGLNIITTSLPAWVSGQPGSFTITAEGGSLPLRWSVKSGSLPQGFTLSQDGILSGSYILPSGVTKKIFAPFTAEVKDQKGQTKSVEFSITIAPEAPTIITYNPPTLIVGEPYDGVIAKASGGLPPYKFGRQTSSGPIPFGMDAHYVGSSLYFTGSPKAKGRYSFSVCVYDSVNTEKCGDVSVEVKEAEVAAPTPVPAPTPAPAPEPAPAPSGPTFSVSPQTLSCKQIVGPFDRGYPLTHIIRIAINVTSRLPTSVTMDWGGTFSSRILQFGCGSWTQDPNNENDCNRKEGQPETTTVTFDADPDAESARVWVSGDQLRNDVGVFSLESREGHFEWSVRCAQ